MNGYTTAIIGATNEISRSIIEKLIKIGEDSFFLTGRDEEKLHGLINELSVNYPKVAFVSRVFEITPGGQTVAALEESLPENIKVNRLVYTLGINYLASALEVTEDVWNTVFDVNVKGFFFVAQFFAKHMILNNGGRIVAVASQHGIRPNIDRSPYCASKAALIMTIKTLALELAKYNILVNAVAPTFIKYEKNANTLDSPRYSKFALSRIPLHEYAKADDVAEAICFLLTSNTNMITGHTLPVDGGWMLS